MWKNWYTTAPLNLLPGSKVISEKLIHHPLIYYPVVTWFWQFGYKNLTPPPGTRPPTLDVDPPLCLNNKFWRKGLLDHKNIHTYFLIYQLFYWFCCFSILKVAKFSLFPYFLHMFVFGKYACIISCKFGGRGRIGKK